MNVYGHKLVLGREAGSACASFGAITWDFSCIKREAPDRAAALELAGSPCDLVRQLKDSLENALDANDTIVIGREKHDENRDSFRAVVQFRVGAKLFDWFFNARSGYRAHFASHYKFGLRFNNQIISELFSVIEARPLISISGCDLDSQLKIVRRVEIEKVFLRTSLVPYLAKIWFSTNRIGGQSSMPCYLGPKLIVDNMAWAAVFHERDEDSLLDIKGAFVCGKRIFQTKPVMRRAKGLQKDGTA